MEVKSLGATVVQLFPPPSRSLPLKGLYLKHELHLIGQKSGRAFVYANFITSLDGRIAIPRPVYQGLLVPKEISNPRDWRLFHELAIQADVILSSGRYLREYAKGEAQDIISSLMEPRFADLMAWRSDQGLDPKPVLGVISASLDFSLPEGIWENYRGVLVYTSNAADPARVGQLQKQNAKVFFRGEMGSVDGKRLISSLSEQGYRTVYVTAGPRVFHMLLDARVVDRLYLTLALRLLGGQEYASIVEGGLLEPPFDLELHELYYDRWALDGIGQLFSCYDRDKS